MDVLFAFLKYVAYGMAGLFGVLIVLVLLFGKRVRKRWEYEAEFRDTKGREYGEFDIELSRIEKQEADYRLKAKLHLRHSGLDVHDTVRVLVEDKLVLEGMVRKAGRIALGNEHLQNTIEQPRAGQLCRVLVGSQELAVATLVRD